MVPRILQLWKSLECQRNAVVRSVERLGVERWQLRESAGCWSSIEVLDHLVRVEEATAAELEKNISGNRTVKLRERIGVWAVLGMMRSPLRIKVPAGAAMVLPESGCSYDAAMKRWEAVRQRLWESAKAVTEEQMKIGVMRHPISGWMTMPSAFRFLAAHLRHHEYQLERIEAKVWRP